MKKNSKKALPKGKPGKVNDGVHDDGTKLIHNPESPCTRNHKKSDHLNGNMYFNQTSSGQLSGMMEATSSFTKFLSKYKN